MAVMASSWPIFHSSNGPSQFGAHLEEHGFRQFLLEAEFAHPGEQEPELVRRSRRHARVGVASVGAQLLRVGRGIHGSVAARLPLHRLSGDQPRVAGGFGGDVVRGVHADVDELPVAGDALVEERGQCREHREVGCGVVALLGPTDRRQAVVVVTAAPGRSGGRHHREIRVRPVALRIVPAEGRHGHMDEVVARRGEVLVVETECRQAVSGLRLEQHVRGRDQCAEAFRVFRPVEIERHAALARVVVPPVEAAVCTGLVVEVRRVVACRVAARRFHQDHIGAHVGQQLAGEGDGIARQFDDACAGERAHIAPSSRSCAMS